MIGINGLFIPRSAAGCHGLQLVERIEFVAPHSMPAAHAAPHCQQGSEASGGEMSNVIRLTQENGGELNQSAVDPRKTSDDADMPAESVGHDLCAARQRSGKTLMDVWQETKIPPHHLIAIETSRFDALPGHVYAIGFVRSYSAYLGLDPEISVARLRAEMSGSNAAPPVLGPLAPPPRKDPEAEFDRSGDAEEPMIGLLSPPERKWPHSVAAVLLIAAVIYSGYYVVASARRMAPQPVIPVPARLAAEAGFTGKQAGTVSLATVRQPARTSSGLVLLPSTQLVPTEPITVPPLTPVALAPALPAKPALASSTKVAPTRHNSVRSSRPLSQDSLAPGACPSHHWTRPQRKRPPYFLYRGAVSFAAAAGTALRHGEQERANHIARAPLDPPRRARNRQPNPHRSRA